MTVQEDIWGILVTPLLPSTTVSLYSQFPFTVCTLESLETPFQKESWEDGVEIVQWVEITAGTVPTLYTAGLGLILAFHLVSQAIQD